MQCQWSAIDLDTCIRIGEVLAKVRYWPQADVDHTVQKQEKVDVRHEPVETDVELTQRPLPLPHPVSKYLALVIVHRVGSWISKVSVAGPIQHWR